MKIRLCPIRMSKLILVSSLGKSTQLKKTHTNGFFFPICNAFQQKKNVDGRNPQHENESYHQQFIHLMNISQRAPVSFNFPIDFFSTSVHTFLCHTHTASWSL